MSSCGGDGAGGSKSAPAGGGEEIAAPMSDERSAQRLLPLLDAFEPDPPCEDINVSILHLNYIFIINRNRPSKDYKKYYKNFRLPVGGDDAARGTSGDCRACARATPHTLPARPRGRRRRGVQGNASKAAVHSVDQAGYQFCLTALSALRRGFYIIQGYTNTIFSSLERGATVTGYFCFQWKIEIVIIQRPSK